MSGNRHRVKPEDAPRDDLEHDPGIGQTKGVDRAGEPPEGIAGEHTTEGDVMNDVTRSGAVDPHQRGHGPD